MPDSSSADASSVTTNWLQQLLEAGDSQLLPREAIDRWLASGRTHAEDLLAARQAGGDVELLRMALTNFPFFIWRQAQSDFQRAPVERAEHRPHGIERRPVESGVCGKAFTVNSSILFIGFT